MPESQRELPTIDPDNTAALSNADIRAITKDAIEFRLEMGRILTAGSEELHFSAVAVDLQRDNLVALHRQHLGKKLSDRNPLAVAMAKERNELRVESQATQTAARALLNKRPPAKK